MNEHGSDLAIETAGLAKTFGKTHAVDGVDLSYGRGPCTVSSARTARARPPW